VVLQTQQRCLTNSFGTVGDQALALLVLVLQKAMGVVAVIDNTATGVSAR
jgi:hypothetical protein